MAAVRGSGARRGSCDFCGGGGYHHLQETTGLEHVGVSEPVLLRSQALGVLFERPLQSLELRDDIMTSLRESLPYLSSLQRLHVTGSRLHEVEPTTLLRALPLLTELGLHAPRTLPTSHTVLRALSGLRTLQLCASPVTSEWLRDTSLPPSVASLHLAWSTQLRCLQPIVDALPGLTELDLFACRTLTSLAPLSQLPHLRRLSAAYLLQHAGKKPAAVANAYFQPLATCSRLRRLVLHSNRLVAIPPALLLAGAGQLRELNLMLNELTGPLATELILAQRHLRILDVSCNGLDVPRSISDPGISLLQELEQLRLGSNHRRDGDDDGGGGDGGSGIWRLHRLHSLSLSNVGLRHVPSAMCASPFLSAALEALELRGNLLQALPASLRLLSGLRSLDLARNRLAQAETTLSVLGQLPLLEFLDVSANDLTSVPPELASLMQLRHLDISHNRLTVFPVEFHALCLDQCLTILNPWHDVEIEFMCWSEVQRRLFQKAQQGAPISLLRLALRCINSRRHLFADTNLLPLPEELKVLLRRREG